MATVAEEVMATVGEEVMATVADEVMATVAEEVMATVAEEVMATFGGVWGLCHPQGVCRACVIHRVCVGACVIHRGFVGPLSSTEGVCGASVIHRGCIASSREAATSGSSKLYMAPPPNYDPEVLHDKMADIRNVLDGTYRPDPSDAILLEGCAGDFFGGKPVSFEPSGSSSELSTSLLSIPGLLGSSLTYEDSPATRATGNTFKCSICYKDFGRNWLLKRHMRTHTGEKPYACGFCDYRSSYRYQLAMHVQSVHRGQHGGNNL
ncbi:Zinc finger C2H2-type [Trinorchestia longiramus]|nr:Zinc finger C2H2-type [Trinorchestia longiramus]